MNWKPKVGEKYWFISINYETGKMGPVESVCDDEDHSTYNCFKDSDDAMMAMRNINASLSHDRPSTSNILGFISGLRKLGLCLATERFSPIDMSATSSIQVDHKQSHISVLGQKIVSERDVLLLQHSFIRSENLFSGVPSEVHHILRELVYYEILSIEDADYLRKAHPKHLGDIEAILNSNKKYRAKKWYVSGSVSLDECIKYTDTANLFVLRGQYHARPLYKEERGPDIRPKVGDTLAEAIEELKSKGFRYVKHEGAIVPIQEVIVCK